MFATAKEEFVAVTTVPVQLVRSWVQCGWYLGCIQHCSAGLIARALQQLVAKQWRASAACIGWNGSLQTAHILLHKHFWSLYGEYKDNSKPCGFPPLLSNTSNLFCWRGWAKSHCCQSSTLLLFISLLSGNEAGGSSWQKSQALAAYNPGAICCTMCRIKAC